MRCNNKKYNVIIDKKYNNYYLMNYIIVNTLHIVQTIGELINFFY